MGPALKRAESTGFYSFPSLQAKLTETRFSVFPKTLNKGKTMKRHIASIPLAALLALVMANASAQSPAPAAGASAPATVGVTPQEAARANQQAVPRSDTATVVRTAPSPADRASAALSGNTNNTATGTSPDMSGSASTRAARADRN